jgi:hypothetical protein
MAVSLKPRACTPIHSEIESVNQTDDFISEERKAEINKSKTDKLKD